MPVLIPTRTRLLFSLMICALLPGAGCAWAKEAMFKDIETIPASCKVSPYGPGDWLRTLRHGGRDRRYIVHVPSGYTPARAVPLVLFFHGGGGNAENTRGWVGLDRKADSENFIVVYPDGTGKFKRLFHTFNAGRCGGYAYDNNVDDVGFTAAILDEMEKTFCIDRKRVYASGFSVGAMMCYRLACELSGRIAAIGPVSGTPCIDDCSPARPVPVIHFHGSADEVVPMKGGPGKRVPGSVRQNVFRSVRDTTTMWTRRSGASSTSGGRMTRGKATRVVYPGGQGGAEMELWTLEGAGHTWPGSKSMPFEFYVGRTNRDISATDLIWDFFKRHPMK